MCREGTFFIIIIQLVASWWLKSLVHSHCYTISDLCDFCFDCRAFDVNGETSSFDIVDFVDAGIDSDDFMTSHSFLSCSRWAVMNHSILAHVTVNI